MTKQFVDGGTNIFQKTKQKKQKNIAKIPGKRLPDTRANDHLPPLRSNRQPCRAAAWLRTRAKASGTCALNSFSAESVEQPFVLAV